ncbi:MAG: hypothetical protein DRQ55_17590 [Planctomycetota bacterium]|nr:MAG: hypothetical protein DRQ55_17590 [Planctomycetota bacterium]
MARSIEEARALRPGLLALADRVLQYFVPAVLIAAAGAFTFWTVGLTILSGEPDITRATFAALAVLVMGYPCALGMATPLAMIRGGGMAAERGILMRTGEAFELMQDVRTIVLDKTGTITRGEPEVVDLALDGDTTVEEFLGVAAAVEGLSEHPLARAVEQAADERGIEIPGVDEFRSTTGSGVEAQLDGVKILVGKPAYLAAQGVPMGRLDARRSELERRAQTVIGAAWRSRHGGSVVDDRVVWTLGFRGHSRDKLLSSCLAIWLNAQQAGIHSKS